MFGYNLLTRSRSHVSSHFLCQGQRGHCLLSHSPHVKVSDDIVSMLSIPQVKVSENIYSVTSHSSVKVREDKVSVLSHSSGQGQWRHYFYALAFLGSRSLGTFFHRSRSVGTWFICDHISQVMVNGDIVSVHVKVRDLAQCFHQLRQHMTLYVTYDVFAVF